MELCFGEPRANPILKVEFLVLRALAADEFVFTDRARATSEHPQYCRLALHLSQLKAP